MMNKSAAFAAGVAAAVRDRVKTAAGSSSGDQGPGTGDGSTATVGEYERDAQAPGVTGRDTGRLRPQSGRKLMVGGGTGRGVPEWVRLLTRPPGQTVGQLPGDMPTGE